MSVKKGQEIEVVIDALAFGGKGIARVDGLTVFVDHGIPGDHVTATVYKRKKSYAEARITKITNPSTDRIQPPCLYSGICGGCKLQYLNYHKQLWYKRQHVAKRGMRASCHRLQIGFRIP
jgi:23S rRNA (uracil1939-C5)-methyltransferase